MCLRCWVDKTVLAWLCTLAKLQLLWLEELKNSWKFKEKKMKQQRHQKSIGKLTWAPKRASPKQGDTSPTAQTSNSKNMLLCLYGRWELGKGTCWDTLIFLEYYAPVLDPSSQRVVPHVPDLLNPQGWMNIEFDCVVPPTASPNLGEEQAHTLPMFLMSPITNVFPKESLFPFLLTFPLQLAMCHDREKQHRQQHTEAAQSLWQITAEARQPWDASQLCHLQTKATRKTSTEIFPFPFLS